jgi:hypothetical protein
LFEIRFLSSQLLVIPLCQNDHRGIVAPHSLRSFSKRPSQSGVFSNIRKKASKFSITWKPLAKSSGEEGKSLLTSTEAWTLPRAVPGLRRYSS